jgi:hypothetical protein
MSTIWRSRADGWASSAVSQRGTPGVTPVVIRASVLGRLLGIRLLRLEADITLVPADPGPPSTVGPSSGVVTRFATTGRSRDLTDARELLAHASRTLDDTSHLVTARKRPGA